MLFQHHAIGLQLNCMVAAVAEVARLPHVCHMALDYGLLPSFDDSGRISATLPK